MQNTKSQNLGQWGEKRGINIQKYQKVKKANISRLSVENSISVWIHIGTLDDLCVGERMATSVHTLVA